MAPRFRQSIPPAIAVVLCLGLGAFALAGAQSRSSAGKPALAAQGAGGILLTWGVGGVLTGDGTLWQYRPEKAKWVTIDESFRMDGEQRQVLPLPVAAQDVQFMQGFGFLVTRNGTTWLYDLDENRWRNIGSPVR